MKVFLLLFLQKKKSLLLALMKDIAAEGKHWIASLRSQ
jgi:hypothetical protein